MGHNNNHFGPKRKHNNTEKRYNNMKKAIMNTTEKLVAAVATTLIIAACGASGGRFHLEGKFKNLNQGEFYIYNMEQGDKDTIAVRDGRFTYEVALKEAATLTLLFPNYSELPIFAQPGATVSIDGDVSHLKATKINGTDDNDQMTEFRMDTNDMTPPEVARRAGEYIRKHPTSPVSIYMLQHYFIINSEPDYATAYELCTIMKNKQPDNVQVAQLHRQLELLKNSQATDRLPAFKATDTEGRTADNSALKNRVNVVCVWASWCFESQTALRQLHQMQKDNPGSISVVTIAMDASPHEGKSVIDNDSITWPNICDGLMWQSPLIAQMGIPYVPYAIIADSTGHIVTRTTTGETMKKEIEKLLN